MFRVLADSQSPDTIYSSIGSNGCVLVDGKPSGGIELGVASKDGSQGTIELFPRQVASLAMALLEHLGNQGPDLKAVLLSEAINELRCALDDERI